MFRSFAFEEDMRETLTMIPLAVRRKLDLAGLKIGRADWESLPYVEREVLCHLPVDEDLEVRIYRDALVHFASRASISLTAIEPHERDRSQWSGDRVPTIVQARLSTTHLRLTHAWSALDDEARYCVYKYAQPEKREERFVALVLELGGERIA
ncbi:MAG: nitrate reductase associated protein [Deltaproteobacteria bacterium]|nr:nitrate reductase associated protein [Deltaproteobacteria bacterium]